MAYTEEELKHIRDFFSNPTWDLYKEKTLFPLIQEALSKMAYKPGKPFDKEEVVYWSTVFEVVNLFVKTPETLLVHLQTINKMNEPGSNEEAIPW